MSKKNRVPVNLVQIATRLAAQTTLWEPLIAYDPISRYYARLARESDFEAWLLTWVPGQGTEWHDHGGSAGAFITVRGSLTEEHAVVSPDGPPRVARHSRELTDTWPHARSETPGVSPSRSPVSVSSAQSRIRSRS